MSNTIQNFLIGIGLDFDDKGAKEARSGIDGIRSSALQAGAAIAGAFGLKKLTSDFADANAMMGRFGENFGVIPNDVAAMGRVYEKAGGSTNELMGQLEQVEKLRAKTKVGDWDFVAKAGVTGFDPDSILKAKNATEAMAAIADQMQGMDRQSRINLVSALGLDNTSLNVLAKGGDAFKSAIDMQKQLRPKTQAMIETSKEFQSAWVDMWARVGSETDKASMKILPKVNEIINSINGFYDENKKAIDDGVEKSFGFIADHFVAIAGASTLLGGSGILKTFSGLAKIVPGLGASLGTAATGLSRFLGGAGIIFAAYEILKSSSKGDEFSATGLFGDNALTNFLDTPISDLFSSDSDNEENSFNDVDQTMPVYSYGLDDRQDVYDKYSGTTITPKEVSQLAQPKPFYEYNTPQQQQGDSTQSNNQQQFTKPIQVMVNLNSQPFYDMIYKVNEEQADAVLDDIKGYYGG